jgi:hypothetical protein
LIFAGHDATVSSHASSNKVHRYCDNFRQQTNQLNTDMTLSGVLPITSAVCVVHGSHRPAHNNAISIDIPDIIGLPATLTRTSQTMKYIQHWTLHNQQPLFFGFMHLH